MINSVSHDSVCRLGADRPMCFATALDKAFENIDCMSAILRCQAKNHIYESTQRLIQPRRVLCRLTVVSLMGASINCIPWPSDCKSDSRSARDLTAGAIDGAVRVLRYEQSA